MQTLKPLDFILADGSTPSDGSAALVPYAQPRTLPLGVDVAIPFRTRFAGKLPANLSGWTILISFRDAETGYLREQRQVAPANIDPAGLASLVIIRRADTAAGGVLSATNALEVDMIAIDTTPDANTWRGVEPSAWHPVASIGDPTAPFTLPAPPQQLVNARFLGPWVNTTAYLVNDQVTYLDPNGGTPSKLSSFRCLVANTNVPPLDGGGALSADWAYVAERGADGGGSTDTASVASIAAMRASGAYATAVRASLSGYYADGDGGGGPFYWDGLSVLADDGGLTIKPTAVSGAGRWRRLYKGSLNVKWFGAKGDGDSHPLSGFFASLAAAQVIYPHATALTNEVDWAAIQGAIAAVKAAQINTGNTLRATGGRVQIPKGSYLCDQTIDLHQTVGITMSGDGHGSVGTGSSTNGASTLFYTPTGSKRFIDARSSFALTLQDLGLVNSSATYTGYLVDFSHSNGSDAQSGTIRNCALSGGLSVNIVAGQGAKALLFLGNAISMLVDNSVFAVAKQGIRFRDPDGAYSNAHVVQNSQFVYLQAAWVNASENCVFSGNTVEGSGGQLRAAYLDDYLRVDAALANAITFNNAAKTITRSSGSWIADGWVVGMVPTVFEQTGLNTGDKTAVASLTATVLTLAASTGLVDEVRASDCKVYSTSIVPGAISPTTDATLGVTLTFAGSTITRNNGSWITDGALLAQQLNITTPLNAGATTRLTGLSATVLDYSADTLTFSNVAKTITRSSGSWLTDGFVVGDVPLCIGSSAGNNGTLSAITNLTATVMTLASAPANEISTIVDIYTLVDNALGAHTVASAGITFVNEAATAGQIFQTFGGGPLTFSGNWMGDQFRPDVWLQFGLISSVQVMGNQMVGNRRAVECFNDGTGLYVAGNHLTTTQEPIRFRNLQGVTIVGNGLASPAADIVAKISGTNLFMAGNVISGNFPADEINTSIKSWITRLKNPMQLLTTAPGLPGNSLALQINQGSGPTLALGADAGFAYVQSNGAPLQIGWLGPDTYLNAFGFGRVRVGYNYNDAAPAPTSLLHVGGAIATSYASKTADYALLITDSFVDLDATANNVTATLPDATTCKAREYTIKRVDAPGAFFAHVATVSGQTVDGAASPYNLAAQNGTVVVVSNGANWRIKAKF